MEKLYLFPFVSVATGQPFLDPSGRDLQGGGLYVPARLAANLLNKLSMMPF